MNGIFKFNSDVIWKLNESKDKIDKCIKELSIGQFDQRIIDRCVLNLEQIKERCEEGLKLFTEVKK